MMMITIDTLKSLLPKRAPDTHKHACGHVVVVGGDAGMSGAPLLAGRSALRAGAGLVTLATHPDSVLPARVSTPELMCHGVHHPQQLVSLLGMADVVVVGPGMQANAWSQAMIQWVVDAGTPMVVDAGALGYLLDKELDLTQCVCTPHPGEAAWMLGVSSAVVQKNRPKATETLVEQFGGTMVLKGAGTLIRHQADTMCCPFGTPGLATAGTGDVLAGMIGALLAQGCTPFDAATLGVGLHALAGEVAAQEKTVYSMLASDVIEALPQAFAKLL